jgi:hypothetical protein
MSSTRDDLYSSEVCGSVAQAVTYTSEVKKISTPMPSSDAVSKKISKCEESEAELSDDGRTKSSIPYQQAIGSLLYLLNGTNPDITFAIDVLILSRQ